MGPRNLLILFFSTVAVSLVILIIFFSLFFKNVDLNFNTRLPETAPDIGSHFPTGASMNPESKADGVHRSSINVPPELKEPEIKPEAKNSEKTEPPLPPEADLAPISDDAMLENTLPPDAEEPLTPLSDPQASGKNQQAGKPSHSSARKLDIQSPTRQTYPTERPTSSQDPLTMPPGNPPATPAEEGPPVPGQ